MRTFLLVVLAAVASGCAGAMAEPAPSAGPPVIAQASGEDVQCTRDTQCVLVQDCCGCERQGRQLAVHRDRVQALSAAATDACASTGCTVARSTHRSCTASRAVCRGGICIPDVN